MVQTGAFQNVAGANLTGLPRAVNRDLLGFSGCDILECTRSDNCLLARPQIYPILFSENENTKSIDEKAAPITNQLQHGRHDT
jgi:hypothetical protein